MSHLKSNYFLKLIARGLAFVATGFDKLAVLLGAFVWHSWLFIQSFYHRSIARKTGVSRKRKMPTIRIGKWLKSNSNLNSAEVEVKPDQNKVCGFGAKLGTMCLSIRSSWLKFILLPSLCLLSIVIIYKYVIHNHQDALPSYEAQDSVTRDAIASIINTANSLPMSFPSHVHKNKVTLLGHNGQLEYVSLTIHKSIYTAFKKVGLSAKMARQFMDIFSDTVNFAKDVRDGDKCIVLFKRKPLVGKKKVSPGNEILAAELIRHSKVHRAIRFTDSKGYTAYYTPSGFSLQPSFLRAPLNYKRISSKFSYHRWHPIFNFYRAHLGVDFAAPYRTPIKAAANGTISFLGTKGGYGRAIMIKHDGRYTTLYGHMSGYAKSLWVGSRVRKGEVIGFVGSSGDSDGMHLHYELHDYGIPRDPLTVKLPHLSIPPGKDRARFFAVARGLLAQLNGYHSQYASLDSDGTTA